MTNFQSTQELISCAKTLLIDGRLYLCKTPSQRESASSPIFFSSIYEPQFFQFPKESLESGTHLSNLYPIKEQNDEEEEYLEGSDYFPDEKFSEFKAIFARAMPEMLVAHTVYYDHYKSFLVLFGQMIVLDDKQFIQSLKLDLKDALNTGDVSAFHALLLQKTQFVGINQDVSLLSVLLAAYLYHLLLEQVYFQQLALDYDPVAERLFANGFVLYVLLRTKLEFSLFEGIIKHFGQPMCIKYENDFKRIPQVHPFRGLRRIDEWMMQYNLWRLTLARMRRFYLSLQLALSLPSLTQFIGYFEPQMQFFMQWLNFLYFLPRVLMDLAHLAYHLLYFPNPELNLKQRFQIYIHRRWESLLRDSLWLTNGFLSLFVFTGGLGFLGLYLAAIIQLAEVLLNLFIVLQAQKQQQAITQDISGLSPFFEPSKKLALSQELKKRDEVDVVIRQIRLQNSLGVLICNILVLPCFVGLHAAVPLIGATLGLVMSVIQFSSISYFNKLRKTIGDPLVTGPNLELPKSSSRYQLCQP